MEKFESNNVTIAVNLLYAKKEKIYREKQVILLMIPNGEQHWHYLAVKKLPSLLRRNTKKTMVIFIV